MCEVRVKCLFMRTPKAFILFVSQIQLEFILMAEKYIFFTVWKTDTFTFTGIDLEFIYRMVQEDLLTEKL